MGIFGVKVNLLAFCAQFCAGFGPSGALGGKRLKKGLKFSGF